VPDVLDGGGLDAAQMCGQLGQPCCSGAACGASLVCLGLLTDGLCTPCGALGQWCCAGGACDQGRCTVVGSEAFCIDQSDGGNPGATGEPCDAQQEDAHCTDSTARCAASQDGTDYCIACGGAGQPCCMANVTGRCEGGLSCRSLDALNLRVCR
jgi:hypothetical protein